MCHRFLPIDRYNRYQSNQLYRFLSINYSEKCSFLLNVTELSSGTTVPETISPPSGTAPYETEKAPTEPRRVRKVESQETAIVKQPWFWAVVAGVTVVLVTTVVAVKWRKRRLNQNKDRQQSIPLVQRK